MSKNISLTKAEIDILLDAITYFKDLATHDILYGGEEGSVGLPLHSRENILLKSVLQKLKSSNKGEE